MKRIVFALCLSMCLACVGHAQQTMFVSKATNTNTDTSYISVKLPGFYNVVSFQAVQTKSSGTVAGYALLQGSLDGTNFVNISNDTLTLANQAINTKIWTLSNSPYTHYRIAMRTSNGVSVPSGFYVARKENQ